MKHWTLLRLPVLIGIVVSACFAFPAQSQDWSFDTTVYAWVPETRTRVVAPRGMVQTRLSRHDALDNLDAAVMLSGTARNGNWSLAGDLMYLAVSTSAPTPYGLLFSKVKTETRLTAASAYTFYSVGETSDYRLDLGVGARAVHSDIRLNFLPGLLHGETVKIEDSWVDPLIALRLNYNFNDKWSSGLALDYGGFGWGSASNETWQAVAVFRYTLNDKWSIVGGWRHLHFDRENNGTPYKLTMSGPLLGATFRF